MNQGDKVRAVFTNNLKETTGVHFHGVEFDDFFQDGVPFVTQKPIVPGETYTYEFTARNAGSLMYHSHHNATDQVGRGLLGAFLVEPTANPVTYDREYVWISNDSLGGFTINGHGFPATVPVLAAVGETVLIRFMNEGVMMHPWHSHGYAMKVVARDGIPLGSAAFSCDTLGVNPGERWDATITVDRPGHLGIPLPHPAARGGVGRNVRHGQHADRGARQGRRRCDHQGRDELALTTVTSRSALPSQDEHSGSRVGGISAHRVRLTNAQTPACQYPPAVSVGGCQEGSRALIFNVSLPVKS